MGGSWIKIREIMGENIEGGFNLGYKMRVIQCIYM